MKGKFDAYVLWPLAKWVQNRIVDQSTAHDFTVTLFKNAINLNATTKIQILDDIYLQGLMYVSCYVLVTYVSCV